VPLQQRGRAIRFPFDKSTACAWDEALGSPWKPVEHLSDPIKLPRLKGEIELF
jgi:hypothetical protein